MNKEVTLNRTNSEVEQNAQAIVRTADALVGRQEQWFKTEYKRSNVKLYEILSQVLAMWEQVAQDKALRIETVKQMKAALTAAGVRVQTNTLALTLFVRYVFRTDRQRAMNYSRTLQAAIAAGVDAKGLPDFIERSGGVEECKRKLAKSPEVLNKQISIEAAMPLVEEQLEEAFAKPLATFSVPGAFTNSLGGEYVFVMARADAQGQLRALTAVPASSAGVTKWAKQQLAMLIVKQAAQAELAAKAKDVSDAIAVVVQSKTPTALETVGELATA